MVIPSITQVLIYTAAIRGAALFWTNFTIRAWEMVSRLTNEMFVEEGEFAEEAERQGPN